MLGKLDSGIVKINLPGSFGKFEEFLLCDFLYVSENKRKSVQGKSREFTLFVRKAVLRLIWSKIKVATFTVERWEEWRGPIEMHCSRGCKRRGRRDYRKPIWVAFRRGASVQKYAIFISAHAPAPVCPSRTPAKRENRNKDSDDTREPG